MAGGHRKACCKDGRVGSRTASACSASRYPIPIQDSKIYPEPLRCSRSRSPKTPESPRSNPYTPDAHKALAFLQSPDHNFSKTNIVFREIRSNDPHVHRQLRFYPTPPSQQRKVSFLGVVMPHLPGEIIRAVFSQFLSFLVNLIDFPSSFEALVNFIRLQSFSVV